MPLPYTNKEYIDHIETFLTDTVVEGANRVSAPVKMLVRDLAILIEATNMAGAIVTIEYSPDDMETPEAALVPATMSWYSRLDGTFTDPGPTAKKFWENIEGAEGWFRVSVSNFVALVGLKVKTRPRVEMTI